MLTDEGIEGGEGLDLLEGLLEVGETGGVVHEGVYAVFEFIGQGIIRGDEVVLEVLSVDGETLGLLVSGFCAGI